jgi:hypothetical protein
MRNIKVLIWLVVIGFSLYVGSQVMPTYYNSFQFQDEIESEARLNSYSTKPETEIQESLLKKAKELDLPITPEHLHVVRNGSELTIWGDYTVHVDIPIHPFDLTFTPSTRNKRI